SPITTITPFIESGKIRPIVLTSANRSAMLPNVPTAEEAGLKGYTVDQWWGLFLPGKSPREIVNHLNADTVAAVANDDVAQKLKIQGIEPSVSTPEEFANLFRADIDRWRTLAKSIDLGAD